jgi:HPt (histidine-containing phosphotransfer) domain-containing protein
MSAEDVSLLDMEVVEGLQMMDDDDDDDDEDFFGEMIDLYADQGPISMEEIKSYFAAQDLKGVGDAAHTLKGASLNVGAKAVAATSAIIEKNAKAGNFDNLEEYLAEINTSFTQTLDALRALKS